MPLGRLAVGVRSAWCRAAFGWTCRAVAADELAPVAARRSRASGVVAAGQVTVSVFAVEACGQAGTAFPNGPDPKIRP
jgi:hypothetical protein